MIHLTVTSHICPYGEMRTELTLMIVRLNVPIEAHTQDKSRIIIFIYGRYKYWRFGILGIPICLLD